MSNLREILRARLAPFDDHHGHKHRDEKNVRNHNIHDHARGADHEIESNARIGDPGGHNNPSKVTMHRAEECTLALALEDHVMPPADEDLHGGGDEHDDADAFVSAGLLSAIVVSVADGKPDDTANDSDDGGEQLRDPVPADAVHESEDEGASGHEDEEAEDGEGGVDDEDGGGGCAG